MKKNSFLEEENENDSSSKIEEKKSIDNTSYRNSSPMHSKPLFLERFQKKFKSKFGLGRKF